MIWGRIEWLGHKGKQLNTGFKVCSLVNTDKNPIDNNYDLKIFAKAIL